MKNPRILAAITSILAMDPLRGVALMQAVVDEIKGVGPEILHSVEHDKAYTHSFSGGNISSLTIPIYHISEFGWAASPKDAPAGSVAVISFDSPITKYDWWWAGTISKANILEQCFANDNIIGIVQHMDTPGGESAAPERYVAAMQKRNKPVVTVIDGLCASCGYWLASPTDEIYCMSKTDEVGSVGTYTTVANFIKYFESQGIILDDVYATLSSKKNFAYREAMKGNFEPLREEVNFWNEFFIATVKKYRGYKFDDIENVIHGDIYFAKDALKHGMIDGIAGYDYAVQRILDLSVSNSKSKTILHHV